MTNVLNLADMVSLNDVLTKNVQLGDRCIAEIYALITASSLALKEIYPNKDEFSDKYEYAIGNFATYSEEACYLFEKTVERLVLRTN